MTTPSHRGAGFCPAPRFSPDFFSMFTPRHSTADTVGPMPTGKIAAAVLLALALLASPASAATFGQLGEPWGKAGSGAGQFFKPGVFGVDPDSGDAYAGDMNSAGTLYRIQRFSEEGALEATVEFSRKDEATGKLIKLVGIAVDPARERIYVLEACKALSGSLVCTGTTGDYSALRVHAFSTAGGGLASAGTFALPSGADELYQPTSIAVDPLSGELVLLGEDAQNNAGHIVVERFTAAGVPGGRFVDSASALKSSLVAPLPSLAVGPGGTTYMLTTGAGTADSGSATTRAWELPPDLSGASLSPVPGFAAAEDEEWPLRANVERSPGGLYAGPTLAISKDGSTLYWKERYTAGESTLNEALVRGFSLSEGKTRVLYGGGEARCRIKTGWAGIGAAGEGASEELLVFDYGPEQASPSYGAHVLRFGEGGSGCPASLARFTVEGEDRDGVVVGKGESVSFDASTSELEPEAIPRELVWSFGDGTEEVVRCREEAGECVKPAALTVSHEYASAGEFTVTLELKLVAPIFGNPVPVQHTLTVPTPMFSLSVFKGGTGSGTVTSSPAGIDCGSVCGAEFEQGALVTLTPQPAAGSEFGGWSGACTGSGGCQVTIDEAASVTVTFALEEGTPPPTEFELTVFRTGTGAGTVTSSPAGIDCGTACIVEFGAGQIVTLVADPDPGSEFAGWSGACAGAGACEVPIDEARSVSAGFEPQPPPPPLRFSLTVLKAGSGSGTVASTRTGIYCGARCEREYEEGETVTLIPTAIPGSSFAGWGGGACAGTGVCKLTMDAAQSVTATFELNPPRLVEAAPIVRAADPPASPPAKPKPKPTARQRALRRCRKLSGAKRARCIRRIGRGRHRARQRGNRHGGIS